MKTFLTVFLCLAATAFGQYNLSTGSANINIARGTAGQAWVIGTGTDTIVLTVGTSGKLHANGPAYDEGDNAVSLQNHINQGTFYTNGTMQAGGFGAVGNVQAWNAAGSDITILESNGLQTQTGTSGFVTLLRFTPATASRTLTFPDSTGTLLTSVGGTASGLTLASGTTQLLGSLLVGSGTAGTVITGSGSGVSVQSPAGNTSADTAPVFRVWAGKYSRLAMTVTENGGISFNQGVDLLGNTLLLSGASGQTISGTQWTMNNATTGFGYSGATGLVEVNNGTQGNLRDLRLRNLTGTGTATSLNNGGIVASGTSSTVATGSSGLLINVALGTSATTSGWRLGLGTNGSLQAIGTAGTIKTLAP